MTNKHFNPYDGANVNQDDWTADQNYHKEQRRVSLDKTIRSGVVNAGLIQTDSLKVYPDSYKTNAHFIDNRSLFVETACLVHHSLEHFGE